MKKQMLVGLIFASSMSFANESSLNLPVQQEKTQEEVQEIRAENLKKSQETAAWREHQKVLKFIDRYDRD